MTLERSGHGPTPRPETAAAWGSFHLYYHEDRSRLLVELVAPVVRDLLVHGWIDRFFFILYPLGGPHVRLRVRWTPGGREQGRGHLAEVAGRFFRAAPSRRSIPEVTLQATTAGVLASDPNETDDSIYPDNYWVEAPFVPEVDRYGGAEVLELAFEFFAVSSVVAMRFHEERRSSGHARRLGAAARLLALQARAFARDRADLLDLIDYVRDMRATLHEQARERAVEVWERDPEPFRRLVEDSSRDAAAAPGKRETLSAAAGSLAEALSSSTPRARRSALLSQMHMTANRLGLHNAEEVYLGELLRRAAETGANEGRFPRFPAPPPAAADAGQRLRGLTDRAMEELT